MNRWKRNLVWGIVFLFMLSICGCQGDDSSKSDQQLKEAQELTSDHKDDTLDKKEGITVSPAIKEQEEDLDGMKEISIYTLDSDTAEKVPVVALVPKDTMLTPQLIVDKVVESMTDAACMVGVDSVTTDGDKVIISFKEDQPPVVNVGSSVEAGILDSFAQSILDNVLEYHKIIFRIMGNPYVTGHFEFGIDEVYMETSSNVSEDKQKSSASSVAQVQIKDLDDMKELPIYTLDSETVEKVSLTALVPNNTVLTPQLIVDKVVESMTDAACMVGVDSVTTEGDKVIISFKEDQPPVVNVGSSVELGILDSFAQSILDNLPEYHKIIFRIMDQPYATGHFELGINEVYMESSGN